MKNKIRASVRFAAFTGGLLLSTALFAQEPALPPAEFQEPDAVMPFDDMSAAENFPMVEADPFFPPPPVEVDVADDLPMMMATDNFDSFLPPKETSAGIIASPGAPMPPPPNGVEAPQPSFMPAQAIAQPLPSGNNKALPLDIAGTPPPAQPSVQDSGHFEAASALALPGDASSSPKPIALPLNLPSSKATVTAAPKKTGTAIDVLFPSEGMIGKMTDELYLKMADLERESAIISLQIKREQLQNDLYRTHADQRQKIADEIAKREQTARERLDWELSLEEKRAEIEERRRLSALKIRQIEEALAAANAETEDLTDDAAAKDTPTDSADRKRELVMRDIPSTDARLGDFVFRLVEVRGSGGVMFARLRATFTPLPDDNDKQTKQQDGKNRVETFFVRKGTVLPNGYEVEDISQNAVALRSKTGETVSLTIPIAGFVMHGTN